MPTQNALVAKKVGEVDLGFYATAEYLARHGTPTSFDELETHALIGFDSPARSVRDLPGLNMPIDRELFAFRTDSDLAQLAAVGAGFGIRSASR